ncbi:MAG: ComEC/Rec2 family competence protein, partial [Lachnospiraceae bacterium]|nr:ComEC/Rec2 family competence protein [Lachnospiraceae bacterium]
MKRPVFWAVVMFALGEVIGQYVQTGKQISIAFVMLICFACILYYLETQRRLVGARFLKWFLVIGVPIGFLHNYMFSGSKQLERHRMPEGVTTVSVLVQITELSGMEKGMHATVDIKECESREVRLALGRRLQVYLPDTYDWTEDSYMQAPQIGDLILISGCVELIAPPENPGEFDRRQYYLSRGIRYEMKKTTSAKLIKRPQISYKRSVQKLRNYLRDVLYMACDEETAGLYTGILLGDKSGISEETKTLFLMAGIAHILSISALHISLVAMSVYRLLRRLGVRIASTACASGILILVYGSLTNWSFSAIRAGIMLLLVLLGELLGRKTDLLTGASISLFIMLLAEPERIRDGGVQIGFSSIVAIAVAQEILKHMRKHKRLSLVWKRHKWMYRIIAAVITSLTIFFLTVPVLTRLYFFVSPYSPILNLFVVPLMTPVVILGLLGMVLSLVNSSAGGALLYVGGLILKLFCRGCMRVQKLPFCSIGTGKPALAEAICYYLAFVLLMFLLSGWFQGWLRKKLYVRFHKWYTAKTWGKIMIALSCVYLLVCGFGIGMLHRAYLCEEVVFLSVGQGDGVLIRTGEGINLVIDGGSSTRKNIGENVLKPSIKSLA